ncbi:leucine-rich repeat domain-containing protein [Desulfococcus sp.]|uniref:leucine-rich repeat domain-containing protein n=1 Tax=Desulfococcus sp. TaxID=2025834 RepID=UPI0035940299
MRNIKKVKSVRGYGIIWAFCLVFIVCSCGGGGGSSSGPSSESGEISFSLRLEEEISDSGELQEESTGLDCSGNHIDTIKAEILNSAGEVIARGGPFNCTDGHLTVTGVPVGQNYVVAVTALDLDGFVIFSGEETGVTVAPGISNEVGPIILRQVLNRKPRIMPAIGNRRVLEGETLQFSVHAEDPDDANHVTCTASDLPAGAEFDPETGLFSWTPEYGKAGLYRVMFRAVDDGDPPMSDAEIVAISVGDGNQPPVVWPLKNYAVQTGETVSFEVTASDPDQGDTLTFSASNLPAGAVFNPETRIFTWATGPEDAGFYIVSFLVMDNGNPPLGNGRQVTITVGDDVDHMPEMDPIGSQQVLVNELLEFVVTARDLDGDHLTFTAGNMPAGATFNPEAQRFSWTPGGGEEGTHTIIFTVTDDGIPPQGDSEEVVITVGVGNHGPVLDPIGSREVREDELIEFVITATDPDNDALVFSATGLPDGAIFDPDTQKFSWNPGFEDADIYEVEFTVEDVRADSLSDTETVTITVGNLNRPPVFEEIGEQSIDLYTKSLLSFTVTARDPDGDTLSYEMTDGPEGAVFADQTFQWAPTRNDVGMEHSASFRVTDNKGLSDTMTVNIRVMDDFPVAFPDANFEAVIRGQLNLHNGTIMKSDLMSLSALSGYNRNITSIEGLQHCENLQVVNFDLCYQISDFGPLAGLVKLQYLILSQTQISDITHLAGLVNLQKLILDYTQISDVTPLAGLVNLQVLYLDYTQISDITPLAGLKSLQVLSLDSTQISDITPLSGLVNLQSLLLYNTQISDITPLAGLVNLQSIFLGYTQISDITPLSGLVNLQSLVLYNTQISDITPLAGLVSLQFLSLDSTQISDITSLTGLANLQSIYLYNNQISDITPLLGLNNLVYIDVSNNPLDVDSCTSIIPQLEAKGVTVVHTCFERPAF